MFNSTTEIKTMTTVVMASVCGFSVLAISAAACLSVGMLGMGIICAAYSAVNPAPADEPEFITFGQLFRRIM